MNDEQILKKAIEKAVKNGWEHFELEVVNINESELVVRGLNGGSRVSIEEIIFSHDFAKAFWGEEDTRILAVETRFGNGEIMRTYLKQWEHHLMQMVLEKEPLKYLEKFL